MAHLCNPRTWEIETGKLRSSMPTWATEQVLFQLGNPRPHLKKKKSTHPMCFSHPRLLAHPHAPVTGSCQRVSESSEPFLCTWALRLIKSSTMILTEAQKHWGHHPKWIWSKAPGRGWGGGGRADLWNRDSRAELYWKSLRFLTLQRLLSLPWPTSLKGEKAA